MSWTIDLSGTPTNVIAAIDQHAEKLQGENRTEFDGVSDQLKLLVSFAAPTNQNKFIRIVASGHASIAGGQVQHKYCSINIEPSQTATV